MAANTDTALKKYIFKSMCLGVEEMVQWGKCSLCQDEDLSVQTSFLIISADIEPGMVCVSVTQHWEAEPREPLGLAGQRV